MEPPNKAPVARADRLSGVLVFDKPRGISSMRAVAMVRRRAGGVKTGHAGTLDPLATGVLVLALGRATKSIERLMNTSKRYRTSIDLSAFTTTDDLEGDRTEVPVSTPPQRSDIDAALDRFRGEIMQRPPRFSAVKVAGRRAYKLARQGKEPQLAPRPVVVHGLTIVDYVFPMVEVDIHCGKGFYVRSFARDLGESLGAGGFCAAIRRTAVGPFTLDEALDEGTLPEQIVQADLMWVDEAMRRVEVAQSAG